MIVLDKLQGCVNELFFVYGQKPMKELDNHVSFEDFTYVMFNKLNVCRDDNMRDDERIMRMYNEYVNVFNTYRGNIKNHFYNKTLNRCYIKPFLIFGPDLWTKTKGTGGKDYFLSRCYKEEFVDELVKKRQGTWSEESMKKKYGDDWEDKFNEFVDKANKSRNSNPNINEINYSKGKLLRFEYFLDKINEDTGKLYTEEEAKEKIRKKQQLNSKKYADKSRGKKGITCRSVEYWIERGMSVDEAKEKVREIQSTNTIENYIKKYGEQEGIKKWIDRNKKWGKIMMEKKSESNNIGSAYSKSSKRLFDKVIDELRKDDIVFEKVYYGEQEYSKWDKDNHRVYFYDFVIPSIKLCVEYNGVMYHPKEGDVNWVGLHSGITYTEKIEYDKQKIKTINDCGFTSLIIWEDDDEDESVQKIINLCKQLM